MSQQPPEGAYAQPQDPWEGGFEPGLASVPTDPIPEQRYQPYPQGPGPSDLWSQQTVAQGGYVPQPAPNRTGMIVLIVLIVLVLGGGGGYAAWYVTSKRNPSVDPTAGPTSSGTATTTTNAPPQFDPYAVKVTDCIRNNNASVPSPDVVDPDPDIEIVPCTTKDSYKVIKIVVGEDLVENAQDKLDRDTTAPAACADTSYKYWYAYDATDDTQDLFFCLIAAG